MTDRSERRAAETLQKAGLHWEADAVENLTVTWAAFERGPSPFRESLRWLQLILPWYGVNDQEIQVALGTIEDMLHDEAPAIFSEPSTAPIHAPLLQSPKDWQTDTALDGLERYAADIALAAVARYYLRHPSEALAVGPPMVRRCLADACQIVSLLRVALWVGSPPLFIGPIEWLRSILIAKIGSSRSLRELLQEFIHVCDTRMGEDRESIAELLTKAIQAIERADAAGDAGPHVDPLSAVATTYLDKLLRNDRQGARELILSQAKSGTPVAEIHDDVFAKVLEEVGRLWQLGKLSVAVEHFFTATTQSLMSQLYSYLDIAPAKGRTVIVTAIEGNHHAVAAQMLADRFEMDGWEAQYLGADTPNVSLPRLLTERNANLLAVSVTMPHHIPALRDLVAQVRGDERTREIPIIVGGRPFKLDSELASKVGADAYGDTVAGCGDWECLGRRRLID